MFAKNDSKTYNCVVGGAAHSKNYSGLFCYGLEASEHSRNYSARVVHIPEANSIIEKDNYQLWLISNV
jgi:aspartate 1-decarboxylase